MKSLEDMIKESTHGSRRQQDLFAEQFNKVNYMIHKDYGINSIHVAFIVRDILDRVYSGERVVEIDKNKMINYNNPRIVPLPNSDCYIIPLGCSHKEIPANYYQHDDVFIDETGKEYYRPSVQAWRYKEEDET